MFRLIVDEVVKGIETISEPTLQRHTRRFTRQRTEKKLRIKRVCKLMGSIRELMLIDGHYKTVVKHRNQFDKV